MATQFFRQSDGPFEPVRPRLQPPVASADAADTESDRLRLLAATDQLLTEIEEMSEEEAARLTERASLS